MLQCHLNVYAQCPHAINSRWKNKGKKLKIAHGRPRLMGFQHWNIRMWWPCPVGIQVMQALSWEETQILSAWSNPTPDWELFFPWKSADCRQPGAARHGTHPPYSKAGWASAHPEACRWEGKGKKLSSLNHLTWSHAITFAHQPVSVRWPHSRKRMFSNDNDIFRALGRVLQRNRISVYFKGPY